MTGFEEHLDREVHYTRERLAREMRSLADTMTDLALNLEKNPEKAIINDLGEVQARGASIDTGCARYATTRRLLAEYRAFEEAGQ